VTRRERMQARADKREAICIDHGTEEEGELS
jgi:hypothetical protein